MKVLLRAVGGALIAVAGVVLGLFALLLLRGHDVSPAGPGPVVAGAPSLRAAPSAKGAPPATAAKRPLAVLNNSPVSGLAGRAAAAFRAAGWPVTAVDDYAGRVPQTTVFFGPGEAAAARALAAAFPGIVRVLPRPGTLPATVTGTPLTVVLTGDFSP